MQIAQKLYEGTNIGSETTGLITYMRTDGVQLGTEAIAALRDDIGTRYGARYVPEKHRVYKTKAANAQEAHEAVRPTDINRSPDKMRSYLDHDQARLYELIWKRTIASQMQSAELDQTGVDIGDAADSVTLRANGQVIVFDGFMSVYRESKDAADDREKSTDGNHGRSSTNGAILPEMSKAEALATRKIILGSILLNLHLVSPMPALSNAWRSWVSADHRPMRQLCRCHRHATM